jgi:hypothetical protein
MREGYRQVMGTMMFWLGIILLNIWVYTYLGNNYNLERWVGIGSITFVSITHYYFLVNSEVEK